MPVTLQPALAFHFSQQKRNLETTQIEPITSQGHQMSIANQPTMQPTQNYPGSILSQASPQMNVVFLDSLGCRKSIEGAGSNMYQTPATGDYETWVSHQASLGDKANLVSQYPLETQVSVANYAPNVPQLNFTDLHSKGQDNETQFLKRGPDTISLPRRIQGFQDLQVPLETRKENRLRPMSGDFSPTRHRETIHSQDRWVSDVTPKCGFFVGSSVVSDAWATKCDSSILDAASWQSHNLLPKPVHFNPGTYPNSREAYFMDNVDRSSVSSVSSSTSVESSLKATRTSTSGSIDEEDEPFFGMVMSNLGKLYGERKSLVELEIGKILHIAQYSKSVKMYKGTRPNAPSCNENVPNDINREVNEQLDRDFCMSRILPVFNRLDKERKMWAKLKILETTFQW